MLLHISSTKITFIIQEIQEEERFTSTRDDLNISQLGCVSLHRGGYAPRWTLNP